MGIPTNLPSPSDERTWSKNRHLVKGGYPDLAYLPGREVRWDATLTALAYSVRQHLFGNADLSIWAVANGVPASGRYEELDGDATILWHGTAAAKAPTILEKGLRPVNKGAVYASLDPSISHGYTRMRSGQREGGSALLVLVIGQRDMEERFHASQSAYEVRLRAHVDPGYIEYVLWSDRNEFVGASASKASQPWSISPFKKKNGEWIPRSQPPVRFADEASFHTKGEWLQLSTRRVLRTLGEVSAMEVFSSLYSTVEPWEALSHDEVFAVLDGEGIRSRVHRNTKVFSLHGE